MTEYLVQGQSMPEYPHSRIRGSEWEATTVNNSDARDRVPGGRRIKTVLFARVSDH